MEMVVINDVIDDVITQPQVHLSHSWATQRARTTWEQEV